MKSYVSTVCRLIATYGRVPNRKIETISNAITGLLLKIDPDQLQNSRETAERR